MAKSALFTAKLNLNYDRAAVYGVSPSFQATLDAAIALGEGTGLGQFDIAYIAERTVADGANDDIDLRGVLQDAFGQTINNAEIVMILIVNKPRLSTDDDNVTHLTIGGAANPFLGFLGGAGQIIGPIRAGGFLMLGSPHGQGIGTVVAGTGDTLRVANSSGGFPAKYQIAILGRSA